MIELTYNDGSGNAVNILVKPLSGTVNWRLLRNTTGTFTGYDDPDAVVVYEGLGTDATQALDIDNLKNGTRYYYREFDYVGNTWVDGDSDSIISVQDDIQVGDDPFEIVLHRFEDGLLCEIESGRLVTSSGLIDVLTAPPVWDETRWPAVTVKVLSDAITDLVIGNRIRPDVVSGDQWREFKSYFGKMTLEITGWSLNINTRILLRQIFRRIINMNLDVFAASGFYDLTWSQKDAEDFTSYAAPTYQTKGTLSFTYIMSEARLIPSVDEVRVHGEASYSINP